MRYGFGFLAVIILATGCAGPRSMIKEQAANLSMPEPTPQPYILGIDDVVKIKVETHPELSGDFPVTPEGTVFLPLLGDVTAKGLTKEELAKVLQERYSEYVKEVRLTVGISQYRSKKIYALGEIHKPGIVYMKGNVLNLLDAIVQAGLPTEDAALDRVYVITPALHDPVIKKVNMKKVMYKGIMAENLMLKPNDIVVVPASFSSSLSSYLDIILAPSRRIKELDKIYHYFENREKYLEREIVIYE